MAQRGRGSCALRSPRMQWPCHACLQTSPLCHQRTMACSHAGLGCMHATVHALQASLAPAPCLAPPTCSTCPPHHVLAPVHAPITSPCPSHPLPPCPPRPPGALPAALRPCPSASTHYISISCLSSHRPAAPCPPRRVLVPLTPGKPCVTKGKFTLLSYNLLADLYATVSAFVCHSCG